MSISVRFACGHPRQELGEAVDAAPTCPICGERRVSHVQAPPPRFRGAVRGPCVVSDRGSASPVRGNGDDAF